MYIGGGDRKSKPAWQGDSGYGWVHETEPSFWWEVGVLHMLGGSACDFGNTGFGKVLDESWNEKTGSWQVAVRYAI